MTRRLRTPEPEWGMSIIFKGLAILGLLTFCVAVVVVMHVAVHWYRIEEVGSEREHGIQARDHHRRDSR